MQMVNAIQGLARIDGTDLSATVLWVGLAVQPEGHEHDAFLTQVHTCCNDLLDVPIMHALPDSHGVHLKQKSVAELRRSSAGAEDVTPVTFGESIPHLLVDFLFGRDVHAQSWLETIQHCETYDPNMVSELATSLSLRESEDRGSNVHIEPFVIAPQWKITQVSDL
eukprot:TRINITY_DN20121_c0_g1_i2.p1 TRINITY_DN20121_c0_g1~~TRINITY_DN20121_c0_g1_i2.p1  ORF type:complete len:166 (+),score=27.27 TRINITY_DN20121_c0_g1_i2:239-736(+)